MFVQQLARTAGRSCSGCPLQTDLLALKLAGCLGLDAFSFRRERQGVAAAVAPPWQQQRPLAQGAAAAPEGRPKPSAGNQEQRQQRQQRTLPKYLAADMPALAARMEEALASGKPRAALRLLPPEGALPLATLKQRIATAQVFDAALRACASLGYGVWAVTTATRMWRAGVPVGTVAHTAVLRALCRQVWPSAGQGMAERSCYRGLGAGPLLRAFSRQAQ